MYGDIAEVSCPLHRVKSFVNTVKDTVQVIRGRDYFPSNYISDCAVVLRFGLLRAHLQRHLATVRELDRSEDIPLRIYMKVRKIIEMGTFACTNRKFMEAESRARQLCVDIIEKERIVLVDNRNGLADQAREYLHYLRFELMNLETMRIALLELTEHLGNHKTQRSYCGTAVTSTGKVRA